MRIISGYTTPLPWFLVLSNLIPPSIQQQTAFHWDTEKFNNQQNYLLMQKFNMQLQRDWNLENCHGSIHWKNTDNAMDIRRYYCRINEQKSENDCPVQDLNKVLPEFKIVQIPRN